MIKCSLCADLNSNVKATHPHFRKTQNQKVNSFINIQSNFPSPYYIDEADHTIPRSPTESSSQRADEPVDSPSRSPEQHILPREDERAETI